MKHLLFVSALLFVTPAWSQALVVATCGSGSYPVGQLHQLTMNPHKPATSACRRRRCWGRLWGSKERPRRFLRQRHRLRLKAAHGPRRAQERRKPARHPAVATCRACVGAARPGHVEGAGGKFVRQRGAAERGVKPVEDESAGAIVLCRHRRGSFAAGYQRRPRGERLVDGRIDAVLHHGNLD